MADVTPTATETPPVLPTPDTASHQPAPNVLEPRDASVDRVTAVGDSVMLGAVNQLGTTFGNVDIDAQTSRQASAATNVLGARRAASQPGSVVIIHVGNNGIFRAAQFDEMMQILADVRRVVFVNIKVPRRWEGPNNATLAEKVPQYPNAMLVDWYAASAGRPDFFWNDGIHLRPGGAQAYAALIAAAVNGQ